jgi:hypothetical protein
MSVVDQKYYFAKIGTGNRYAERYLNGRGEVSFPSVPIYFDGKHSDEDSFLASGTAKEQGRHFFECGKENDGKTIVIVHAGVVYFARPTGPVIFAESSLPEEPGFVKLLPVEVIHRKPIADVPMVLASIAANRYYSSGTFRPIGRRGNILAIQAALGRPIDLPAEPSITNALECLCSVEFETLVARLFEEGGCFVPAYRGGYMQDADVIAKNLTDGDVTINGVRIERDRGIALQIKLHSGTVVPPLGVDFLVSLDAHSGPRALGADWLRSAIARAPKAGAWLRSSLRWLPENYLGATLGF